MIVILKAGKDKFLRRGYPWVFRNLVERIEGNPASGDLVRIADSSGHVFGQGFFHSASQIMVRFMTADPDVVVDTNFLRGRILKAKRLRDATIGESTHMRLVYGESDGLPGTIVDRYDDVLTWSTLCYGMEQRRDDLLDILEEIYSPSAIVERNDNILREKDELEQSKGVLRGALSAPVRLSEEGLAFDIDVLEGPKTGFFIDQRFNRRPVRGLSRGRSVLDVFCADGGFGLHAAAGGADSVHAVDISESALSRARHNAKINGLEDRFTFDCADAMEWLGTVAGKRHYDVVILDPPAFAKGRRHREQGIRAYQRININGMRLLSDEGVLVTSSCSQAIDEDEFLKIIRYSAKKAGLRFRVLGRGNQPPDHPVLDAMPETQYLKLFILQRLTDELP